MNANNAWNARKPGLGNSLSSTASPTAVKALRHHDRGRGWRRLQVQLCPCLWVSRQHKRKYEGVENGGQVVLSYFNSPETPIISCYPPQNNHMVFKDQKVAIGSPKTLETALVKWRVVNESQVVSRALCHCHSQKALENRPIWNICPTALLVTSCKSMEMTASVSQNLCPGFHLALHIAAPPLSKEKQWAPTSATFLFELITPTKAAQDIYPQVWTHPDTHRFDPTLERLSGACCCCKSFIDKTFVAVFPWQTSNHQQFKGLWKRHQLDRKPCETEQLWVNFV